MASAGKSGRPRKDWSRFCCPSRVSFLPTPMRTNPDLRMPTRSLTRKTRKTMFKRLVLYRTGQVCKPLTLIRSAMKRYVLVSSNASRDILGSVLADLSNTVLSGRNWKMKISMKDRKSTRLNSSHSGESRMPSSA